MEAAQAVRKEIVVQASPERAFEIFTEGLATWWPRQSHHLLSGDNETVVLEPREGGRVYERSVDGAECEWGRVVAYEPPSRVVWTWEISADWQPDPSIHSEVEVRFTPEGDGTRVELEHRGLETFGDRAPEMAESFSSEGGWGGLLVAFKDAAESAD